MRVGILVPSIGAFGKEGFYSLQEVGLARALDVRCEKVYVWKLVPRTQEASRKKLENSHNAILELVPAAQVGVNGIIDLGRLDSAIDALICAADTQLLIPSAAKWAKKHNIRFLPYIGATESHSPNGWKRCLSNFLYYRNLRVYRGCCCLAKTPEVAKQLRRQKVMHITVAPVGLNTDLLKKNYADYSPLTLKEKYGYQETDRIILFIGRLTQEKQPVQMVELFAKLAQSDGHYKLLMVGEGDLKKDVLKTVQAKKLDAKVRLLDRIPNRDIWELYRFAEAFVNLNRQEIFGMSILEAMYYGCKVVAWKAPGPDCIIENGISGWLVDSREEAVLRITGQDGRIGDKAHERIVEEFIWERTVEKILEALGACF